MLKQNGGSALCAAEGNPRSGYCNVVENEKICCGFRDLRAKVFCHGKESSDCAEHSKVSGSADGRLNTLTHGQAKAFYDRLGARQDWQAIYENPAIETLVAHGQFDRASSICEFGCGTGRLAAKLLDGIMPPTATYLGLDVSSTMVDLASKRLKPWSDRSLVVRTNGAPIVPTADQSFDRFIATYVLDLLSIDDVAHLLTDARRILRPAGFFCNVSLTHGQRPISKLVCALWQKIQAWRPALVGGCRPLEMRSYLDDRYWNLWHHSVVCRFGVCSEIVIAELRPALPG